MTLRLPLRLKRLAEVGIPIPAKPRPAYGNDRHAVCIKVSSLYGFKARLEMTLNVMQGPDPIRGTLWATAGCAALVRGTENRIVPNAVRGKGTGKFLHVP